MKGLQSGALSIGMCQHTAELWGCVVGGASAKELGEPEGFSEQGMWEESGRASKEGWKRGYQVVGAGQE